MESHSLSNYQKMEGMMRLPPHGDRKPWVMLAEMLEFCSAGESATAVFAYLYLQRLTREIQVLMSEDHPADMRAIAKKADRLIAMHAPHSHDACAAVATEDQPEELSMVVAAQGARSHKGKGPKLSSFSRGRCAGALTSAREVRSRATHSALLCASTTPNSASRRGGMCLA
jgi:hypothetical protein